MTDKIRVGIDLGSVEEVDAVLQPVKVNPTPTPPTASALMTRTKRKNKRGKIYKKTQKVNLNRAFLMTETRVRFDPELVKIKLFEVF